MWFFDPPDVSKMEEERNVKGLIRALRREYEYGNPIPINAARGLGRMRDSRAVEPLIQILNESRRAFLLGLVAEALGEIGDGRAVDPLIEILNKTLDSRVRDDRVFKAASIALGELGDSRAIEPLLKAGDRLWWNGRGFGSHVKGEPYQALAKLRGAVEPLIKRMLDASTGDPESVSASICSSAADALGVLGDVRAVEPLSTVLQSYMAAHDEGVSASAFIALGKIGGPAATNAIEQARDTEKRAKRAAQERKVKTAADRDTAILQQVEPVSRIPDWAFFTAEGAATIAERDGVVKPGTATLSAFKWAGDADAPASVKLSGQIKCAYCGTHILYELAGTSCTLMCKSASCSQYTMFLHQSTIEDRHIHLLVTTVLSHVVGTPIRLPNVNIDSISCAR